MDAQKQKRFDEMTALFGFCARFPGTVPAALRLWEVPGRRAL